MRTAVLKRKVLSNEKVAPDIFRIRIDIWDEVKRACPGQFIHVRCSSLYDPLLRRPFSIHEVNQNAVGILYRAAGKGTVLLSEKKPGDMLDVMGPLGSGFKIVPGRGPFVIVAGGMGAAPMIFLAKIISGRVEDSAGKRDRADIRVLIGAGTKELVLCEEDFKKLGCSVEIATDDGSYGREGYVSRLFKELVVKMKPLQVYACGPGAMLREIAIEAFRHKISCQMSFEERMGCGVGACLGCVMKVKEPDGSLTYKRVCREGPVFDAEAVVWDET